MSSTDIAVPVFAVLSAALLLVATLAVNEQDGKVHHEEIGEDHTPALSLAGHRVLAVAVFEKVRIGLSGSDGRLCSVLDEVTRHRGRKDVTPAHEPITEVVDVTRHTPPATDKKSRTSSSLDVLEVLDARILGVGPETVLLVVD